MGKRNASYFYCQLNSFRFRIFSRQRISSIHSKTLLMYIYIIYSYENTNIFSNILVTDLYINRLYICVCLIIKQNLYNIFIHIYIYINKSAGYLCTNK